MIRRLAVVVGAATISATGLLAGCGEAGKTPEETTSPSGSATPLPGDKNLQPDGPNSFTPTKPAHPAPTAPPGNHRHHSG